MEIALALVAVLVAVVAVVWGARRSPSAMREGDLRPSVDPVALAQLVGAEVKAQVAETASAALQQNNEQFLTLATERMGAVQEQTKGLLEPFSEQMKKLDETVGRLRTAHEEDKGAVGTMTEQLGRQVAALHDSTTTLSEALRSRSARGVWGENQLRNVIELSGMEPYCDFTEQATFENRSGAGVRPDVRVRLPNGAHLSVDAKVPLDAYLRAQEATDQSTVEAELQAHAKALQDHVKDLARKKYWEGDDQPSPEFVVLFVPGESFLADALRVSPSLLQEAMNQRVLLASPVNLLALLWAVAGGWQQARVNQHARDVADLGTELYERVGTVVGNVEKAGRGLNAAVRAFNGLVASLEGRLLPTMRKFPGLGVGTDELPTPGVVDEVPRSVVAEELPAGDGQQDDS